MRPGQVTRLAQSLLQELVCDWCFGVLFLSTSPSNSMAAIMV